LCDATRAEHVVEAQQPGRAEAGDHADRVQAQIGLPELRDAGESGDVHREPVPEPRFDLLPLPEARPQRDEERRHVLEEQGNADRQAADRHEVQHRHEEEAGQPVRDEQR
jgi:hypothetical protein